MTAVQMILPETDVTTSLDGKEPDLARIRSAVKVVGIMGM